MIVLDTIVHETIWGGSRLSSFVTSGEQHIGHLYSVYGRDGVSNKILNGQWKGKFLNDVYPLFQADFGMETEFFPLTIALTEADEDLSIQVHPNDEAASLMENKARGKRESWYFLIAPASGRIVNGCKIKNADACKKAIADNQYDSVIDTIPIKAGDYVFVEPGTLHSISAGSLVYEIEEGADFTYRFYDYDRMDQNGNKRELHTAKALTALDCTLQSKVTHDMKAGIAEKTYATRKLENVTAYRNESGHMECFTVVYGSCVCDGVIVNHARSVLLWPDEVIGSMSVKLAFVAVYTGGNG